MRLEPFPDILKSRFKETLENPERGVFRFRLDMGGVENYVFFTGQRRRAG